MHQATRFSVRKFSGVGAGSAAEAWGAAVNRKVAAEENTPANRDFFVIMVGDLTCGHWRRVPHDLRNLYVYR